MSSTSQQALKMLGNESFNKRHDKRNYSTELRKLFNAIITRINPEKKFAYQTSIV